MSDSSLVQKMIESPNKSTRTGKISKIAVHCMAGNMTAESCGNFFAKSSTQASSHYGIGSDGGICQYVRERERAWCTGGTKTFCGKTGAQIDQESVTIEVANCGGAPDWAVSDAAYKSLLNLVEDIATRNGIRSVSYHSDGSGTLQAHRWYAAKACPGDYLMERFPKIAQEVTARLGGNTPSSGDSGGDSQGTGVPYLVEVQVDALNIRSSGAVSSPKVGCITDRGLYTILEEKDGWGKLKSGAGWVSLQYVTKK